MSEAPRTAEPRAEGGRSEAARPVALVTLGCARNEVDSEELAGRLHHGGYSLVEDAGSAEAVLVNTCGFVDAAKKDSIDTLLAAADLKGGERGPRAVVAVGCLAERYGDQLAETLPEADAVLGFDHYPDIAARLDDVLAGSPPAPHAPRDRRTLLPLAPAERTARVEPPDLPEGVAPASGPRVTRRRLGSGPSAPLKIASGCDRRCSFCAIPSFRGAFVSRPPADVCAEARWLVDQGVREVVLVSENSTSYGKDLADVRMLEKLLAALGSTPGLARVRVSYLQPAEVRPSLLDVMTGTPGVAPYFDLSFQHASPRVLRRMRRFGGSEQFCDLLAQIRVRAPQAGVRTNVIVGFPGETEEDVSELESFLHAARLDAVGVFGYSDEEGTEASRLDGALPQEVVDERVRRISDLVEATTAERAEERVGETASVLVDHVENLHEGPLHGGGGLAAVRVVEGTAEHQAPEVDGATEVHVPVDLGEVRVGDLLTATVTGSEGVDLLARAEHLIGGIRQTDARREVT